MKFIAKAAIATSAAVFATLFSFNWSEQRGASLSVDSAQARVGRPLTPVSVAGVARRQDRRAGGYGYGLAGAAAVGTAAAVAGSRYYGAGCNVGDPYCSRAGYYAGGPYYGPGVLGARAAYYGGAGGPSYQPTVWGGVSDNDRAMYIKNLHDAGYDPKNNFNANGTIKTQ